MGIKRTVSIRRIDLWGSEPLESKKMKQKMQKNEMPIFPIYFWANFLVILKGKISKEDPILEKSLTRKGKSYVYLQVQVYIAKIVYLQVYHFGYVYL